MGLTWIYLIKDPFTGFHKIGKSDDPDKRLKDLKRQPTKLPIPSDFELIEAWWCDSGIETDLHKYFQPWRKRGEWFRLTIGDLLQIEELLCRCPKFSSRLSQLDEDAASRVEQCIEEDYEEMLCWFAEVKYEAQDASYEIRAINYSEEQEETEQQLGLAS